MSTKIFVNLAVKDLDRSKAFFDRLGFTFNPQFTDETAACMVIADDIYAMLLTHPKFKEFTKKGRMHTSNGSPDLPLLRQQGRGQRDRRHRPAAGGTEAREPQDYGFMYGRSFNDLDGHIWEIIWMDPSHIQRS